MTMSFNNINLFWLQSFVYCICLNHKVFIHFWSMHRVKLACKEKIIMMYIEHVLVWWTRLVAQLKLHMWWSTTNPVLITNLQNILKENGEMINPLTLHRKRNTETDNKWSLSYGIAPGIECLELTETQQSTLLKTKRTCWI